MKVVRFSRLPRIAAAIAALLCLGGSAVSQSLFAQTVLGEGFSVDTARGDRAVVEFAVQRQGRIRVQAIWAGSARNLALILNGPGQTGYYARQDGGSPLALEFKVGQTEMNRGRDWKVSIVNFGGGRASGHVLVEYPGPRQLQLVTPIVREALVATPERQAERPSPAAEPERTFLEDGRVEIRFPDGRIRRQRIGECNYTIIMPDGSRRLVQCVEVQGEEIPDLPPELMARDDLGAVLEAVNASLLDYIKQAVDDESAVENYLTLEEGRNLQERIFLRLEALSILTP